MTQKLVQTKVYCDSSITSKQDCQIGYIGIEVNSVKEGSKYFKISNIKLQKCESNQLEKLSIYLSIVLSKVINTQHLFIFNDNINAVREIQLSLETLEKNFPSISSLQIGWLPNTNNELLTVDFLSRGRHKKTLDYPTEIINKLSNLSYTEIILPDSFPELDHNQFISYTNNEGFLLKVIFGLFEKFDKDCYLSFIKEHLFPKKPSINHILRYENNYRIKKQTKNFFDIDFSMLENVFNFNNDKIVDIKETINKLHENNNIELSFEERKILKDKTSSTNTKLIIEDLFVLSGQNLLFCLDKSKQKNIKNISNTYKDFCSFFIPIEDFEKLKIRYLQEELEILFNFVNNKKYKEKPEENLFSLIKLLLELNTNELNSNLLKISFYLNWLKLFKYNKFEELYKNLTQENLSKINRFFKNKDTNHQNLNGKMLHLFKKNFRIEDFNLSLKKYSQYYYSEMF